MSAVENEIQFLHDGSDTSRKKNGKLVTFKDGAFEDNLQDQRDEIMALQSIFNSEDEEKVVLMSQVMCDNDGLFSMQIDVSVKPVAEKISVNVVLPVKERDDEEEEVQGATAAPQMEDGLTTLPKNVALNRSLSGRNWEGKMEVKHLPPICLYVTFPATYPSSAPPVFCLFGGWLNEAHVESLVAELDCLWQESMAMPVVFKWIDWLENNVLSHLGITDHLILYRNPDINLKLENNMEISGTAAGPEIGELLASMICYNREKMDIEFCQTTHECHVCYDEKLGDKFFRLQSCSHQFCHECMMAYCEMHVMEGTVEELRCPESNCDTLLPPYIMQSVLDPVAYDRWERLLLQKTLDAMTDTIYCPRCESLVIVEDEESYHLGHCPICFFTFCTQCKDTYHPGRACGTDELKLETMKNQDPTKLSATEKAKFDELKEKLEQSLSSKKLLNQNTRSCPSCKIPVEKIGGCNKMTCRCRTSFCWVCRKIIDGYVHFRTGSCQLFPGQTTVHVPVVPPRTLPDAILRIQARLALNPELENKQQLCPACKQRNLKMDRNNHIKCWNCKGSFCFMCKTQIKGNISVHFQGKCDQHS